MTRTVLCLCLSLTALTLGLATAKLCARNTARGEALHRLYQLNEVHSAYNEMLSSEVEAHVPGGEGWPHQPAFALLETGDLEW